MLILIGSRVYQDACTRGWDQGEGEGLAGSIWRRPFVELDVSKHLQVVLSFESLGLPLWVGGESGPGGVIGGVPASAKSGCEENGLMMESKAANAPSSKLQGGRIHHRARQSTSRVKAHVDDWRFRMSEESSKERSKRTATELQVTNSYD